jgi:hypothetical protein
MDDGGLYDYLQQTFGLGSYDEGMTDKQWWQARATEVSKIKASRRKHGVTVDTLYETAQYCAAEKIPIHNVVMLYRHIPGATRWARQRTLSSRLEAHRVALDDAISEEMRRSPEGSTWLDRLLRVQGTDNIEEVLAEWETQK